MLTRVALRNLRLHWVRSLIVGFLLALGAALIVVGQAALDAIQDGLQRSVVDSLSGHLQLVEDGAPDQLELYQSAALATPDVGQLADFAALKAVVAADPDVAAIIPMGLGRSIVTGKSVLENKLAELRGLVTRGELASAGPLIAHLRRLIGRLEGELAALRKVAADTPETAAQLEDLGRAEGDALWAGLAADPEGTMEFLENRIAPLGLQTGLYFINFLGTDLQAYASNFKLFDMVEGELPAAGERGFLFSTTIYERFIKHRTARRLDQIKEAIELEGRTIAEDDDLQRQIERNVSQVAQITDQLDAPATAALRADLAVELGVPVDDARPLDALLGDFLNMSDANFMARYAFFYTAVAPRIRLYAFRPGDELTLYAQTRSGYPRAINVKIRGVYRTKGLERSALGGAYNLMDLMTYRDLLGLTGGVEAADVAAISAKAGAAKVDAADAEAALFGDGAEVVAETASKTFDELAGRDLDGLRRAAAEAATAPFTQAELESGPVPHAAVFLRDPSRLHITAKELAARLQQRGLKVAAVPWDTARGEAVSGVSMGITVIFIGVVAIVFLVALVVIVNSLLMSTTERTHEIGAMRAMGAPRGFVVRMFAVEALVSALLFGGLGVLLGAVVVLAVGAAGLEAVSEIQYFIFGGRALRPELHAAHIVNALIAVAGVTLVASLIPAAVAARIRPITAMQARD
jgi:ABC-type lipoprotein release transport system permease subunit